MRLSTRVTLVVFVLLVAGIWGLAARVAAVVHADLGDALMRSMSATVGYVEAAVSSNLQLRMDVLKGIAESFAPGRLGDPAYVQQVLKQTGVSAAMFPLGLIVADSNGIYIADYPAVPGRRGASIRDTDFFRRIMAGATQAVSSPLLGRTAKQPLFRIGVPLRDASGAAAGVLFGGAIASDPTMLGNLEQGKIGAHGFVSVLSPKDHLIVSSTDRDRIMQRLPAKGVNPLLDRRLEEGFEGPGITTTSYGVEILTVARKMHITGWVIVAAAPTAEVFAPIAALKRQIYLAALLISLVVAATVGLILRRQLSPLRNAAESMRRMTHGEQALSAIAVDRKDEIGELIGSFNQLAAERIRLDAALRQEVEAHDQAKQALDHALGRLQALSERMTRAQEEQRRKIAIELHEQAGQELTTLMMFLQILDAHCQGKEAQVHLQNARAIARQALERVRVMSLDLHPPQLDELGLYMALRGHCMQQADAAGWILHFDAPESGERPHRDVEIACFRVVQEALTNIAQHANATEVWVSLRESADELLLVVRDNGCGFDVGAAGECRAHASLGLTLMAERVRQVAGHMEIVSAPGGGTEIRVRMPSRSALS